MKRLEGKFIQQERTIAEHKKAIAEHEKIIVKHEKTISEHEKTIAEQQKTIAEQQKTIAEQQKTVKQVGWNPVINILKAAYSFIVANICSQCSASPHSTRRRSRNAY
jgi:uncharacterized coiled-coil protein SlyX